MNSHKLSIIVIKKCIVVLWLLFLLTACKKPRKDSDFNINMDLVLKQNDSIHTYYTTDGSIDFNETQSFWTKIKGSSNNQRVHIDFPDDIVPNQIRIDLGNNILQEVVVLNKLEFLYKSQSFTLKGKEIYRYMRVNESSTILDKNLGLLQRKNKKIKAGPSLYPNGNYLREKLEELTVFKIE
jgi:hypothetical protein